MKLTVITNILTPYRLPLFQAMAEQVDEFHVVLMAKQEENRLWKIEDVPFPVHVLPGLHIRPWGAPVAVHLNYGTAALLKQLHPDIVLNAGFALANLAAYWYCRRAHVPFVHWAHLSLYDGAQTSFVRRRIRHWLIGRCDGAVGESSHARDAFIHYGAPKERIIVATMPLDVTGLHDRVLAIKQTPEYCPLQKTLSKPVLLSIGQIIPRKGYQELFAIYERLLTTHPHTSLLIVGDGPDRAHFETMVRQQGWTQVHFVGFVQAQDLPRYFAISDVFIFHTLYDPFGLVLSEAMAAEVPVVSSIHAMATHDLVEHGVTGFCIDPLQPEASAQTLRHLFDMPPQQRARLINAAYRKVLPCDSRSSASTILEFLATFRTPHERRMAITPETSNRIS